MELPGPVIPYLLRLGSQRLLTIGLASVYFPVSLGITALSLPRTFKLGFLWSRLLPSFLSMGCLLLFPFKEHEVLYQMNSKHPWLKVTEVYLLSSWQYKVGVPALQVALLHTDLGIQPLPVLCFCLPPASTSRWGKEKLEKTHLLLKSLSRGMAHIISTHVLPARSHHKSHQQEEGRCSPFNDKSILCKDNQPSLPHLVSFSSSFRCQVKSCSSRKSALSLQVWGLDAPPVFIQHP